eukprot:TRINITY_DN111230_c0_g1_i1.p1 TRINITY_DN111230_c0_g1~~TRINITY_DN111230_c0_g1_i1.p1  ORF type:complete len:104 (-),score=28.58 TRINITY_DN111230_c0_g1_i1:294-605(-)
MLRHVCEIALASDEGRCVDLSGAFELLTDTGQRRVRLHIPDVVLNAAQARVRTFADSLVHKVEEGNWAFWIESAESSEASEKRTLADQVSEADEVEQGGYHTS